jgi:hypothetical protein
VSRFNFFDNLVDHGVANLARLLVRRNAAEWEHVSGWAGTGALQMLDAFSWLRALSKFLTKRSPPSLDGWDGRQLLTLLEAATANKGMRF